MPLRRRAGLAMLLAPAILSYPLGKLGAQQKLERRFPVAPDAAVRIFNLVGATRIVGWARDTVEAVAVVPEGGGTFYGGGGGGLAEAGVQREGGGLPHAGAPVGGGGAAG